MPLPTVDAARYVTPLREGGSLPAVVEDADGARWVVKFRGAGQGARALLAELVAGGIARRLGLPAAELALVRLADGFGRTEPDAEIQDILKASGGLNVGLRFVPAAFNFETAAFSDLVAPALAADVVWFDALVLNVDRSPRNPNLLVTRDGAPDDEGSAGGDARVWLIDHGAALYVHHDWPSVTPERARAPFPLIEGHVLLPRAGPIAEADARLAPRLTPDVLDAVLGDLPDDLLTAAPPGHPAPFESGDAARAAYRGFLAERLAAPRAWAEAAEAARLRVQAADPERLGYRR